jgi:hypothetical protein
MRVLPKKKKKSMPNADAKNDQSKLDVCTALVSQTLHPVLSWRVIVPDLLSSAVIKPRPFH